MKSMLQNIPSPSSTSCKSNIIIALLALIVIGLSVNAYFSYQLTKELIGTRQIALHHLHSSFVGKLLTMSIEDIHSTFNNSIPDLLAQDLFYNFQQTAQTVQSMAARVTSTAVSRAHFFDGVIRQVFYRIASYSNLVASIANVVSNIPPMQQFSEAEEEVNESEDKYRKDKNHHHQMTETATATTTTTTTNSSSLLQAITNIIVEIPPWVDNQLSASDWKNLGKACNQFFVNFLSMDWNSNFTWYHNDGTFSQNNWQIPSMVLTEILTPIQSTCSHVAGWNVAEIEESDKEMPM